MEEFGETGEDWLKIFLQLPDGIPSHDTFNRVFSALNFEELEKCFAEWTRSVADLCTHEVIAIDDKSMRGGRDAGNKRIVHIGLLGSILYRDRSKRMKRVMGSRLFPVCRNYRYSKAAL